MSLINKAWLFAKKAHEGQVDDDGLPYFEAHILHMTSVLRAVGCSDEIIAAGLLHDTVEDCGVDYPCLVMSFGQKVADLVMEVTHEGKPDNHGYYFPRLKSRDAIVIKLADRISNLLRMDSWSTKRQEQYLRNTRFWKERGQLSK